MKTPITPTPEQKEAARRMARAMGFRLEEGMEEFRVLSESLATRDASHAQEVEELRKWLGESDEQLKKRAEQAESKLGAFAEGNWVQRTKNAEAALAKEKDDNATVHGKNIRLKAALAEMRKERDLWKMDAETMKACWNAACHEIGELKAQIPGRNEK